MSHMLAACGSARTCTFTTKFRTEIPSARRHLHKSWIIRTSRWSPRSQSFPRPPNPWRPFSTEKSPENSPKSVVDESVAREILEEVEGDGDAEEVVKEVLMKAKKPLSQELLRKIAARKLQEKDLEELRESEMEKMDEKWDPMKPVFHTDATQEQIYQLYVTDKQKWTLNRLSRHFQVAREKVAAYLMFKSYEKKLAAEGKFGEQDLKRIKDIENDFPEQFLDVIPGDLETENSVPYEKNNLAFYNLAEPELDERRELTSHLGSVFDIGGNLEFPGERYGEVNDETESVIIKKGTRTKEEVERLKAMGEGDTVVLPGGPRKVNYPAIMQEMDGTIRTLTAYERAAMEKANRDPSVLNRVNIQDRVNAVVEGQKKIPPHPLEYIRKHVKSITLDEFVERKKADPEYYLRQQTERRAVREKERNDKAEQARQEGLAIAKKSRNGGYLRAYYEPKGIYTWTPEKHKPKLIIPDDDEDVPPITDFEVTEVPEKYFEVMDKRIQAFDQEMNAISDEEIQKGAERKRVEGLQRRSSTRKPDEI